MSDLVVLDFNGVGTADEVLTRLRSMQKEHLIDLYRDLTSGELPGIRKVDELVVP